MIRPGPSRDLTQRGTRRRIGNLGRVPAPLRRLVLASGVALTLAGCTTSSGPAPTDPVSASAGSGSNSGSHATSPSASRAATVAATPTVSKIKFANCTQQIASSLPAAQADRVNRLSFGCGRVSVPLDYRQPGGRMLQLYVVKVHDTSQVKRTGSLLVNPGGPGGSGVELAINLGVEVSDDLLAHFDLIGFDPRGVFLSGPLRCISDRDKDRLIGADPDVRTAAGLAEAKRLTGAVATACATKYGTGLPYYNTEATARDMDVVRQGAGDQKMNYLGFSYGTRLGAVYAHLFPGRIRSFVLDGAVDPIATDLVTAERQVRGFEGAFDQFAADCLRRAPCRPLGNPRRAVEALVVKADRRPLRSSDTSDPRTATGAYVLGAAIAALYDQGKWKSLGEALMSAQKGDAKGLFALTDQYNERDQKGHYSNVLDANTTINCNDSRTDPTDRQVQAAATSWAAEYSLFGLSAAAGLLTCQQWQPDRHPVPPVTAHGSKPILVLGTVHDPATPYAAAGVLARALTTGVLLSWNGEGHTAYPKTDCIRHAVDAYLISLTVPPPHTVCAAQ